MRVMIAGGGTGGHVIPALAIAGALKSAYAAEICFVGTARGMETRLVPQAGYALELIDVGQLNRVSLATQVKTLVALPRGILRCLALLRSWQPQVVVGVGGYASGPAMLAALLRRVPTLAFEPNAVPGMANRFIGKRISAAAVNFAPTMGYFRNAELTGIPVRVEFFALPPRSPEKPPRLLVMGGSQGARALNQRMPEIAKALLEAIPGLTILHQAGARHAESTQAAYAAGGAPADRWQVQAFLEDMPSQFAASDLILARSGASTVAELAASGKPSLLVPFPQAADDHQRKNAEVLLEGGAAMMLLEQDMTGDKLLATLTGLLGDRKELNAMSARARTFAHPHAAARIAEMAAGLASGL
ncbi:MAG: undecaprenyldiphospho-muramoylpentapeptide beta-N-acetylglucosaminyltransferase [Acidobacteriaceae bacterium]|jgi:UDP-N-acetylglucosamine--N-acetylmuramyl-(pentapeptide) pyrophosphoryl-undecaprenol N-acetylglucosamine transferase